MNLFANLWTAKRTSEPSVDVIIPVYNPGELLSEALKSCFEQSYRNWKITVVDDCSTEDIRSILKSFPGVQYLRNVKNGGPAFSRNIGIKATDRELISFLDADDVWMRQKLEWTVDTLAKNREAGMVCGNYEIEVNGRRKPFFRRREKIDQSSLLRRNCVATGSVTVRREVLDEVGLFDERLWIAEDYDLWLRISERRPIEYLHKVMYYYRTTGRGAALTERPEVQARHRENVERILRASEERVRASSSVLCENPGAARRMEND